MPLNLPAVPNFQTNIPQVDPLQTYGKMLQLKALQGQQQLIPGQLQLQQQQIQESQTENELKQLQLQSQKGVAAYWSDPSKYDTDPGDSQHNDAIANMLGISPTDPLMAHVRGMLKAGAGPAALVEAKNTLQVRQEWSKATQEQQAVLKNAFEQLREIAAPVMNEHDATKKQALLDSALPGLQRWASFDPSLAQVIPQLHAGNFDAFANRVGAEEKALGLTKTQLENTVQAQKIIPQGGGLSPETQQGVQKDIAEKTNPAIQAAELHLATAKKAAEQAITDGDPRAAAQLLVSGAVAPSQIISSRKPSFAQQAFTAAEQAQPGWSAQKAEADFKVAGSPANVAFFGSAKSLTDKGGTLDQLKDAAKDIPNHQLPIFNTIDDAVKAATGSGPIAKYAAIALGVADDYSKVMGGGQGSDTSRLQALKIISANASQEQRAGSLEGIRGAVSSQTNSRIGNNAVLQKMYGGGATSPEKQAPQYVPGGTAQGFKEGQTGTGSDGKKYVVKKGVWAAQ